MVSLTIKTLLQWVLVQHFIKIDDELEIRCWKEETAEIQASHLAKYEHVSTLADMDDDQKNTIILWVQKITTASLKNRLSLNFTPWNIESAAIPTNKTIAVHARVHLAFPKVLISGRLR